MFLPCKAIATVFLLICSIDAVAGGGYGSGSSCANPIEIFGVCSYQTDANIRSKDECEYCPGGSTWYKFPGDGKEYMFEVYDSSNPKYVDVGISIMSGSSCGALACEAVIDKYHHGGSEVHTMTLSLGTDYYINPFYIGGAADELVLIITP